MENFAKKLKVLERSTSSKKLGISIVTKYLDVSWNNDDASTDRINPVKKING